MNIKVKQKIVVAVVGVLGLGGLGMGTAFAQASSRHTTKATSAVSAAPTTNAEAPESAGPDTDNVQSGDQSTPDSEAADATGKADAPEANGSNHQDANGVNVDYTPAGEAPEAG